MPSFFGHTDIVDRQERLLQRMLQLHQAVKEGRITSEQLSTIAKFTTAVLDEKIKQIDHPEQDDLKKLLGIISSSPKVKIISSPELETALKEFDKDHGTYLDLTPLSVSDEQTLAQYLPDFALLYPLFIQHLSVTQEAGEEEQYSLSIRLSAAKVSWLTWQEVRPIRIAFDPSTAGYSGILAQFLAGKLDPRKGEWLTDEDIKQAGKTLGLQDKGLHIVRFNQEDIGTALHFERKKHERDSPKVPYTIPLIVNLGVSRQHSSLDEQGIHWTRMVVHVDPTGDLPKIRVVYTDELGTPSPSVKKDIEDFLKYQDPKGVVLAKDVQVFQAFPECEVPEVEIRGTGTQKDAYSCGYRAIRGVLGDLNLTETALQRGLLACGEDSIALRKFMYQLLLTEQALPAILPPASRAYMVDPTVHSLAKLNPKMVEVLLLAVDNPTLSKGPLNAERLAFLADKTRKIQESKSKIESLIFISDSAQITLNIGTLLPADGDVETFLESVFLVVKEKKAKNVHIEGVSDSQIQGLIKQIDQLSSNVVVTSDNPQLQDYLGVLEARNKLLKLMGIEVQETNDAMWEQWFEKILFSIPISSSSTFTPNTFVLPADSALFTAINQGKYSFTKLLQYMGDNPDKFLNGYFAYNVLDLSGYGELSWLDVLTEHLASSTPVILFKTISFAWKEAIDGAQLVEKLTKILPLLHAQGVEKLTIPKVVLTAAQIDSLRTLIETKGITTVLHMDKSPETVLWENAALKNKRAVLGASFVLKSEAQVPVSLGKIGKALWGEAKHFEVDIQAQQEQQQQVQQQIQTSVDDSLPDEDELQEETFAIFSSSEETLDRNGFIEQIASFVKLRYPDLSAAHCWDLITGRNAHLFKYGIQKMTMSAAKMLVEYLPDVQYGLNLDNLPRGFAVRKNAEGQLVLTYSALHAPLNPQESPLTLRLRKCMERSQWGGDALQFIDRHKCETLYASMPKPHAFTLDENIENFFYLETAGVPEGLKILHAFIEGLSEKSIADSIMQQIQEVFADSLTSGNISALAEVLYAKNPETLSIFLHHLAELKKVQGDTFFTSFKQCFIDPSKNLNELVNPESTKAINTLKALSKPQATWWCSLTMQHSQNAGLNPPAAEEEFQVLSIAQRWSHLSDSANAFVYFCNELDEIQPGLTLPPYCTLSRVDDMRVGLERLLYILKNAHSLEEQFYEPDALEALSLDALGPFYASRYEGFKLVNKDMLLSLGAITGTAKGDKSGIAQLGYCFRIEKAGVPTSLLNCTGFPQQFKAIFYRYFTSYNHRPCLEFYRQAFTKMRVYAEKEPTSLAYLAAALLVHTTGRRGKSVSLNDIDELAQVWKANPKIFELEVFSWSMLPVQPSLLEMISITRRLQAENRPNMHIFNVVKTEDVAQNMLDSLVLLCKRTVEQCLSLTQFCKMVAEVEGIDLEQGKPADGPNPFAGLPAALRGYAAKILALCTNEGVTGENCQQVARNLYAKIMACNTASPQLASNLLELLAHIDIDKSAAFPSIATVDSLIDDLVGKDMDYGALEEAVKARLPEGCVINMSDVTATSVTGPTNHSAVIAKYMILVKKALEPYKDHMGDLYGALDTPDGPRMLLEMLGEAAKIPWPVHGAIRSVLMGIYNSARDQGIGRIVAAPETNKRLARVMRDRVQQPFESLDFVAFTRKFPDELKFIDETLANLQKIHKKWPSALAPVIAVWDEPQLKAYPVEYLSRVTEQFARNFESSQAFPQGLFAQFFDFTLPIPIENLNHILDVIFDPDVALDAKQRELLGALALEYLKNKPEGTQAFIQKLLKDPPISVRQLEILRQCTDLDAGINALEQLLVLSPESLQDKVMRFFEKGNPQDFVVFMRELEGVDADKKGNVLQIILRAAGRQYDLATVGNVFGHLNALEGPNLERWAALYKTPRHPGLDELLTSLQDAELNWDALQAKYDLEPIAQEGRRFQRDFSVGKLEDYLDHLEDLNYERVLLLSQRQTLQRWFLYVNTIGHERGIPTNPGDLANSEVKVVQKLTHAEIQKLLSYYRGLLQNKGTASEHRIKAQLECIAILREVMYRSTGNFARPTQVLYLLNAMLLGNSFSAQIPTGEGKSLIVALKAAMENLEGHTVDICTSNMALAADGLQKNREFFDYLGIKAHLLSASSPRADYQPEEVHYTTMPQLALFRSRMTVQGDAIEGDTSLVVDEVDYSQIDDDTRYRYATLLDTVTDPHKSPYIWAYEALIQFVDAKTRPVSDEVLLAQAKEALEHAASLNREARKSLDTLKQSPTYDERLSAWLMAAGQTAKLVDQEGVKFRVLTLKHPILGNISKACILTDNRPQIESEFSHGIQQLLHVRLRAKYRADIDKKENPMADFLVEPEKHYVTTMNSKLLVELYPRRFGMSGTLGSADELVELHAKYGTRFVSIPPFADSRRVDLPPILTNPRLLGKVGEEEDHIRKIVRDIQRHIKQSKPADSSGGLCSPVLILCKSKKEGEAIGRALREVLGKPPYKDKHAAIEEYYSSDKTTDELRNAQETAVKEKAGQDGVITISTVLGRGTDIEPTHPKGLYTVVTSVDTAPYSAEDLLRARRQRIGRSGRAGNLGYTRLIVKRGEFSMYSPRQLRRLAATAQDLDRATHDLNQLRSRQRAAQRQTRESFDDVKDIIFKQFRIFLETVNQSEATVPKVDMRQELARSWSTFLREMDENWETIQGRSAQEPIQAMAEFAATKWGEQKGILLKLIEPWCTRYAVSVPDPASLSAKDILGIVQTKHPSLFKHYVKSTQLERIRPISAAAAYCDVWGPEAAAVMDVKKVAVEACQFDLDKIATVLNSPAYRKKLPITLRLDGKKGAAQTKQVMGALLYLRYKALREGNILGFARLTREYRSIVYRISRSANQDFIKGIAQAQEEHLVALISRRGAFEMTKGRYLRYLMKEWQAISPNETNTWKKTSWEDTSKLFSQQASSLLSRYKDKRLARTWVSADRKQVVAILLRELGTKQSPEDVLQVISKARRSILMDDAKLGRSMMASVHGRLASILNHIETRVLAVADKDILLQDFERQFEDMSNILHRFQLCGIGFADDVLGHLTVLGSKDSSKEERYKAALTFMSNIHNQVARDPSLLKDKNWRALYEYCEDQEVSLKQYVATATAIQQDPAVTFTQARLEAVSATRQVTAVVQQLRMQSGKYTLPKEKFMYGNYLVDFASRDIVLDRQNKQFSQMNTQEAYTQILGAVEAHVVEYTPGDVKVKFTSVILDGSRYPKRDGFTLHVEMEVNGRPVKVDYQFDIKSGQVTASLNVGLSTPRQDRSGFFQAHSEDDNERPDDTPPRPPAIKA